MPSCEYNVKIEKLGVKYDIIICGGGPAGVAAAIAAGRRGARTLLIEAQGQTGGMGTSGLVSHWLGGREDNCHTWIVGGIFRELSEQAAEKEIATIPLQPADGKMSPHGWGRAQLTAGIPFNPYKMAAFLDQKLEEAGVDVLLLTSFVDTIVEGENITAVVIHNKSGLQMVEGKMFIDATGDADVADRAGCKTVLGRTPDNLCAPSTVEMHMENVDTTAFSKYIHENSTPRFLDEIKEWREEESWPFDFDRLITVMMEEDDKFMINTSRLCDVNGIDGRSVSNAMVRGRRENLKLLEIIKKKVPGFSNARLSAMAGLIGIRETRRIVGRYTLSVDDLLSAYDKIPDIIGYSSYCWDLPDPKRPSLQPMEGKEKPDRTPIPFRVMHAQPIDNLLCPGRAISVERDVLGPLRVMAPCMAMGEAAGAAAAIWKGEGTFDGKDITHLQEELKSQGAVI